ncbi:MULTISPECIES: LuxR C-terminal-related transcriptional regulator [Tenebrionibacter/Tenebrionicola group]|jgi:DNA-binding NarL/FixJ family response regulator|uniref:Response regulator transcription factor n=2 Tax=Tenebrionibacter/Tenebrionicola group TaxID=2969848 RepID=A0A8K0V4X1_9ENTR|nr:MULTISPECIES: LuxR C-terminal-related transcriptional regulator [Tenebrionibacter/Tenebrionicola group]MBK4715094.1 response regulator transcription factor [Tenebrionibacter intestinalis]MBV4414032.1 response regulator transcription factor [Tenebrionicola larvae]MBV5096246.1 response regulator transcription factor [Tenebrionicola larvae]
MKYQCFLYDQNNFFSEGVKAVILEQFGKSADISYISSGNFTELIDGLNQKKTKNNERWILCDLESFPYDRFSALSIVKECYQKHDQKLVMLLSENNIPLFFALYSLLPEANWLLKNESLYHFVSFFRDLREVASGTRCFSHSLVNYTRMKWLSDNAEYSISSNEWWLMEEIFKGKSLSQISVEVDIDIRKLSYHKRRLMRKLNVRNNIDLFNAFRCIVARPQLVEQV